MEIPRKMRAAILVEQKKPLIVDEVELPETLDYGQVLVRIFFSGICGSQIGEIDGAKGEDRFLPHLLGHEGSGEVMAIGPGVRHVRTGDQVIMHWRPGKGHEAATPRYSWRGKPLNAGFVTTFNEYAVVSENRVTVMPEDFDPRLATLFGCALTTGLGVVSNNAKVKMGESVVVFGAGGVGLNVIQGASLSSAYPIIGVDLYDNKLELARTFGATHLIHSGKQDARSEILKIVGAQGADVVIDNTGNTDIIAMAYELTAAQGRTILVGVPRKGNKISIYSLPLHFGKIMTGSHGGEAEPAVDIPKYMKLHQAGKLRLDGLITDCFDLADINMAISKMRSGEIAGRCLIDMNLKGAVNQ
ncbi:MAG: dehydrogenase [Deltaproteobacteria bacterium HGW-Deltaproteobacteria-6]|jgi:Zn-dependent alcohol dehydrogenase|nr:MAG: dehydrogenase [Deltaproteobacteria bacterium HGW-Deltaproteobacteria-6]